MLVSLQLARCIAILLVVFFHCSAVFALPKYFWIDPLAGFAGFGYAGVDLFFVISGFIIAHVHGKDINHRGALASYAKKRMVRIYPLYWIVFVALCIFLALANSLGNALPMDAEIIIKSLLLLPQNPQFVGGTGAPVVVVAWTLQYEMLFYAIFAAFIYSRRSGFLVLALLAVFCILNPSHYLARFLSNPLILEFALGVLIWMVSRASLGRSEAMALLIFGVGGFVLTGWLDIHGGNFGRSPLELLYGVASACLILALVVFEKRGINNFPNIFTRIGNASYSIYLIHFSVISLACKIFSKGVPYTGMIVLVIYFAIIFSAILAGIVFHIYVEAPMLGFLRLKIDRNQ